MTDIEEALAFRFGDGVPEISEDLSASDFPEKLAARRSHRDYKPDPVDPELVRTLCALALCSPSKSDLQQRDIVIIADADQRAKLMEIIPGNAWMDTAPAFLVFCANNRRQRQMSEWREIPFANDHIDTFFNASVDAGIALATFMMAAESIGLGCCPVSAIRNEAAKVSDLLGMPAHVFPIAGLALGWPAQEGRISMRLPLAATVHTDRFSEDGVSDQITGYDRRRADAQPFAYQRGADQFGEVEGYGWSDDKARQYAVPERADFGSFIRKKGFNLS
ncbi:MAG: nitroreductase family protein [Pseudomonadota bacterium]